MCDDKYKKYEEIVKRYLEERKSFIKREWLKYKSILKRVCGIAKEFNRLRNEDLKSYRKFTEWLCGYMKEKNINLNDEEERKIRDEYVSFLKLHISKMKLRLTYIMSILPITGSLISLLISIFNLNALKDYKDFIIILTLLITITFLASEWIYIKDMESAYEESIEIIKNLEKYTQTTDTRDLRQGMIGCIKKAVRQLWA